VSHDRKLDPVVRVRRSKTDQESAETSSSSSRRRSRRPVPYSASGAWSNARGCSTRAGESNHILPEGTPIFYPVDRKDRVVGHLRADGMIAPISADAIAKIVQRTALRLGSVRPSSQRTRYGRAS
jgi:hypothetical protein